MGSKKVRNLTLSCYVALGLQGDLMWPTLWASPAPSLPLTKEDAKPQPPLATPPPPGPHTPSVPSTSPVHTPGEVKTPPTGSQPPQEGAPSSPKVSPAVSQAPDKATPQTPTQQKSSPSRFFSQNEPIVLKKEHIAQKPISEGESVVTNTRSGQVINFPPTSNVAHKDIFFFQRRLQSTERFKGTVLLKDIDFEVPKNIPFIRDALVYCPRTREVIFQSPPLGSNGKYVSLDRGRRIHLYNLETQSSRVIWSRPADLKGKIDPTMAATPDCAHISVSLSLETKEGGTEYGELFHIQRPKEPTPSQNEWPATKLYKTSRGMKGFKSVAYLGPKSKDTPQGGPPPTLLAVLEGRDESVSEQLLRFRPATSELKKDGTYAVKWVGGFIPLPDSPRILAVSTYDDPTSAFVLTSSPSGKPNSQVFSLQDSPRPIIRGEDFFCSSMAADRSGNRLALSCVLVEGSAAQTAGVLEINASASRPVQVNLVTQVQPYHQLSKVHDPLPVYNQEDNSLFLSLPQMSGQLDEQLLAFPPSKMGPRSESELQFPLHLRRFEVSPL